MAAVVDVLPMREVLELALGSPDDGCVNLKMLHAFLRQLMISAKCENVNVNLKDFTGLREGGVAEFGAGAMIDAAVAKGGNAGDAVSDLWEYIKLRKQVEANKTGIDNLFAMAGKIVDAVGDDRIVTWEALGGALTGFEPEKVHGIVRQTAEGLERAKQYVKDPGKQEQLEQKKAKVLDKFERISLGISRRSSNSKFEKSEAYTPRVHDADHADDHDEDNEEDPEESGLPKKRDQPKENSEAPSLTVMTLTTSSEVFDVDDDDFAEKTINTLGKVALLHGTNEARLSAVDEQLQNLLKFKKSVSYMLQDLDLKTINDKIGLLNGSDVKSLNELLRQLTETGGMEQLQKLIKSINQGDVDERKRMLELQDKLLALETDAMLGGGLGHGVDRKLFVDGADGLSSFGGLSAADTNARMKSGLATQARKIGMAERKIDRVSEELKSAKQELKNLLELVADLMKDVNAGKEMEGKVNELKEMASKLQEELGKQNELIMSMSEAISEYGAELEMLKRQVRHLQEYKADKSWVMKELAKKADLALLENYITKEDFEDCLDDIGKSLSDLQSQHSSLSRLFDWEMKKLLDELMKKMTLDDFESFRKNVNDGLEQLKLRMDFIAGVASGEDDAAGFKISKFHCVSCDRPVHTVAGQQPAPTVPALPGLNVSKSANPFRVLETAKTRKIVNQSNNNKGPLPDPKSSNYSKTVLESEIRWQKRRDFCLNRKYGKADPILADRRDIFDINTAGYYRVFSGDDCVDVWRQSRKCGGETTVVRPWQKRIRGNGGSAGDDDAGAVQGGGNDAGIVGDVKGKVASFESSRNHWQINGNNHQSYAAPVILANPVLDSDSDTDEAAGVVALPIDVVDLNVDITGLSNGCYIGDPNEARATIHPTSPAASPSLPPSLPPSMRPSMTASEKPVDVDGNENRAASPGSSSTAGTKAARARARRKAKTFVS